MNEFELMVLDMRAAQRAYWRMPGSHPNKHGLLKKSKALEKEVDDYLHNKHNPGLF